MKAVRSFFSGLLVAAIAGVWAEALKKSRGTGVRRASLRTLNQTGKLFAEGFSNSSLSTDQALVDLNHAGIEELSAIAGISAEIADRIVENRPYRSKLDLLSRMVIPNDVYRQISHSVEASEPEAPVKVA